MRNKKNHLFIYDREPHHGSGWVSRKHAGLIHSAGAIQTVFLTPSLSLLQPLLFMRVFLFE
jgi:hypothetical protein